MMQYRGYRAAVVFDEDAGLLHGEVVDTRDVITFQGRSVDEIRQAFDDSVDEYLAVCHERGRQPDRPFTGKIPLRVSPQVHRAAVAAARDEGKSLNGWIAATLSRTLGTHHELA